jgi:exosortase H (IPTLxxWG-CTERM-specific)
MVLLGSRVGAPLESTQPGTEWNAIVRSFGHRKHRLRPRHLPDGGAAGRAPAPVLARLTGRAAAWYADKNPILKFVLVFALLLALFYAASLAPVFKRTLFPAYLRGYASAASWILNLLGQHTTAPDTVISSWRFSVDIHRGCDAVDPTALFVAAVLAFPVAWRRKLPGVAIGVALLALLNLVRVVSLFLVGVYFPRVFELTHAEIWQTCFILAALVLWALWIRWAVRAAPSAVHAPH